MPSIQAVIVRGVMQLRGIRWMRGMIAEQRTRQEKQAKFLPLPAGITRTALSIGSIPAEMLEPQNPGKGIILYLHGGAYALGSVNVHREFLARLAKACKLKVLAIDYRLAPENPFPAALEDALAACRWLRAEGYAPTQTALAGDSAGGGLALAALLALRDAGEPLPACAVCISPWVNLAQSPEPAQKRLDPVLSPEGLAVYARHYAGLTELTHPLISPIYADLHGLPPLLIHVGTREILLGQARELHEKARQAGVAAEIKVWEGLFHVFQLVPVLPEARLSLEHIAGFVEYNIAVKLQ